MAIGILEYISCKCNHDMQLIKKHLQMQAQPLPLGVISLISFLLGTLSPNLPRLSLIQTTLEEKKIPLDHKKDKGYYMRGKKRLKLTSYLAFLLPSPNLFLLISFSLLMKGSLFFLLPIYTSSLLMNPCPFQD